MKIDTVPRLEALPATFAATVAALHRVAAGVVSPARKPDNAELTYSELLAARDQRAAALDFFTTRKEARR